MLNSSVKTVISCMMSALASVATQAYATVPGVTALCAYFSPGDQHQHVLAADATGTLHETWFISGGRATGHNIRGQVPGTVALAGYDGTGDHFEHVIAASGDGTLHELFWTP